MKTNKPRIVNPFFEGETRLAGGMGARAARQSAEQTLRRLVLACLLWEDTSYTSGSETARLIAEVIPNVSPQACYDIAVEARTKQGLRHVPLYMAVVMASLDTHKAWVADLITQVCTRADQLTELLAIYWKLNDGKRAVSAQIKKGLARAFDAFDEYQLAKYNRTQEEITLRDVMFLTHPKPPMGGRHELWQRLAQDKLATPETWEVLLSKGTDKRATWEQLIRSRKIGSLAFIRNLRNMEQAGVSVDLISEYFSDVSARTILPHQYLLAAKHAPRFEQDLERMMLSNVSQWRKLPGKSVLIVDVSGSMNSPVSAKSESTRLDAAAGFVMLGLELCEKAVVYATSGDDMTYVHQTQLVPARRGFGWDKRLMELQSSLGGGGIFTRQALEFVKSKEQAADRIIVFSDSEDCDYHNPIPSPWGKQNYIIDVSSGRNGINYKGRWTAELTGFSDYLLQWIREYEAEGMHDASQEQ